MRLDLGVLVSHHYFSCNFIQEFRYSFTIDCYREGFFLNQIYILANKFFFLFCCLCFSLLHFLLMSWLGCAWQL